MRLNSRDYPDITLKILPPFQIENLLPFDINYHLLDKTSHQDHRDKLCKGQVDTLHTMNPLNLLVLKIKVLGTDFNESEIAVITNSDLGYRDDEIRVTDREGRQLNLRLKYNTKLENGSRKVSVYSPYVIQNKTGLDLLFSAKSMLTTSRTAAGQTPSDRSGKREPFMFSYSTFEPVRSRAQIRTPNSDWSKPVSFEVVGHSFQASIPLSARKQEIYLGINVKEGEGKVLAN